MSSRRAAAVIAAVVLVIGLGVGLWPIHVTDDVTCGSAFMPTTRVAEAKTVVAEVTGEPGAVDYLSECNDAIGTRRWIAIPLAGIAALGGLFLLLTNVREDESASPQSQPEPR